MTAKELFQSNKEDSKSHNALINEPWFQRAFAYAKSQLMEDTEVNSDMLKGVRKFEALFMTLSEVPGEPIKFDSGIDHAVDNPTPQKPEAK